MSQDPLEDLLLNAAEVDRARLSSALVDVLGIDTESGRVVLKPGFGGLNARNKLLAYLLGRKAAVLLGKMDVEAASPKDVQQETGMPTGTVNPKLRELLHDRLVSSTETSEYYIAPPQLLHALEELERGTR